MTGNKRLDFWWQSRSWWGYRNFLTFSVVGQVDNGNSSNFADNSWSCWRILWVFLRGGIPHSILLVFVSDVDQDPRSRNFCRNSYRYLRATANSNNFVGSADLPEVCRNRVLLLVYLNFYRRDAKDGLCYRHVSGRLSVCHTPVSCLNG